MSESESLSVDDKSIASENNVLKESELSGEDIRRSIRVETNLSVCYIVNWICKLEDQLRFRIADY